MSKTSTNQELIDGVFSELYVKSRIMINCQCGTDPDIFSGEVPLKIKTVNRCKTPEEFGEQILLAGHQLIGRALSWRYAFAWHRAIANFASPFAKTLPPRLATP